MASTLLERERLGAAAPASSDETVRRADLRRPPTVLGQRSPWPLVEKGHDLAREAIGYCLEKVPLAEAVTKLTPERRDRAEVQIAHDYLACTRFDVPLDKQVDALFVIEDALNRLDEIAAARERRLTGRLRHAVHALSAWCRRTIGRRGTHCAVSG